jgi:hypothetical protein
MQIVLEITNKCSVSSEGTSSYIFAPFAVPNYPSIRNTVKHVLVFSGSHETLFIPDFVWVGDTMFSCSSRKYNEFSEGKLVLQ